MTPSPSQLSEPIAFVLAAGLGTRLHPLTLTVPKALVKVDGQPLIAIVVERLRREGFRGIVVNTHHLATLVERWCEAQRDILVSRETDALLGTGGALRRVVRMLGGSVERLLIHNVDILSNAHLMSLWAEGGMADAALLVSPRETKRQLLFDGGMRLVGWTNTETGEVRTPYEGLRVEACRRLAFSGIHVVGGRLLRLVGEWPEQAFSIVDFYLSQCATSRIMGVEDDRLRLLDVGKPQALAEASGFLRSLGQW